jgi:hypothetical protein
MAVTDRDRQEWAHSPVTQEFLAGLSESKLETMLTWSREGYTQDTAEGTLQANAKALGGVAVLDQVVELVESYKGLGVDNSVEMV